MKKRPFAQDFSGHGKTQQHFKQSCDVNNIVAHYTATGIDPYADRLKQQRFGFASSKTYEEAMRDTAEVNSAFLDLPSAKRAEYQNEPGNWLESLNTAPESLLEAETEPTPSPDTPDPEDSTPDEQDA